MGEDGKNGPAFIVVEADENQKGQGGGEEDGLVVGMPMSVSSPVVASDTARFKVLGVDSQILEVTLPSRGEVLCQPGNLVHMDDGFRGTSTTGGIGRAFQRHLFAGESFYRVNYHNHSSTEGTIGLTPPFPAKVCEAIHLPSFPLLLDYIVMRAGCAVLYWVRMSSIYDAKGRLTIVTIAFDVCATTLYHPGNSGELGQAEWTDH